MKISIVVMMMMFTTTLVLAQEKTTKDVPKNKEVKKLIEQMAGSWKLQRIVDEEKKESAPTKSNDSESNKQNEASGGTQGSEQGNNAMQMIELNPNGRYKINNSTNALDSGSYRINEQNGTLYLESDADDITTTEWKITVEKDQLTLGSDNANSRYKYVYTKVEDKLSTN